MHHFFVSPEVLSASTSPSVDASNLQGTIMLPEKVTHQVRDVLHLGIGEHLLLLDDSGDEILATIIKSNRAGVEVKIATRYPGNNESPVHITLCQGLLKSTRFEWMLEKGTELGVAAFVPVMCRRTMSGLEDASPAKVQRWHRIIQEAAELCGRSRLPKLLPIRPLPDVLENIPLGALALMPWEEEHHHHLREALRRWSQPQHSIPVRQSTNVMLFIGSEGGLTTEEVALAQHHSVHVVTLGPRIMRAETAALAAVADIMYELE